MNELTIGDKLYISSKRAAEITGYAKDYVGQLCREGRVEATLVGRSWYVLEDSIRAHRFGAEAVSATPDTAKKELEAWTSPTYTSDRTPLVPSVMPKAPIVPTPAADISDMQSAWREWFERRQEPLLETPAVIDAREEVQQVPVEPIAAPQSAPEPVYEPVTLDAVEERLSHQEEEERVPIHRFHEVYRPTEARKAAEAAPMQREVERRVVQEAPKAPLEPRPYKAKGKNVRGVSPVWKALLVSIIGLSLAVTVIGSGYLDRFMTQNGFQ
jgi:hypothetical protein